MKRETYKDFAVWGHSIAQQEVLLEPERYAPSGTVTRNSKFVQASGILGVFDTEEEAKEIGLAWARAWSTCPPHRDNRSHC
jgi:hypothetical protein